MVEKINGNVFGIEFKSINEFNEYINNTALNEVFRWKDLSSSNSDGWRNKWCGTSSFQEASDLMLHGWTDMAKKLTQKLEAKKSEIKHGMKSKSVYDVCGYQASVPRYLQGIPTSMVNSKKIPEKQKVITINKCVNYASRVKPEKIEEESVKAMQIIKKLEAQGYRVNLNVVWYDSEYENDYGRIVFVKVRVKNANERLNVSKLAFCLVHPSMLRRMFFRYMEVYPNVTRAFNYCYGYPVSQQRTMQENKGEYVLPALFDKEVNDIKDLEQFRA